MTRLAALRTALDFLTDDTPRYRWGIRRWTLVFWLLLSVNGLLMASLAWRNAQMLSMTCAQQVALITDRTGTLEPERSQLLAQQAQAWCRVPALDGYLLAEQDVIAWRTELGQQRDFYIATQLSLDMLFPLAYGLFLALLIYLVQVRRELAPHRWRLALLPLVAAAFDVAENLAIVLFTLGEGASGLWITQGLSGIKWLLVAASLFMLFWPLRLNIVAARVPLLFIALLLSLGFISNPDGTIANALKAGNNFALFIDSATLVLVFGILVFCFTHAWNLGVLQLGFAEETALRLRIRSFGESGHRPPMIVARNVGIILGLSALPLQQIYSLSFRETPALAHWSFFAGIVSAVLVLLAVEVIRSIARPRIDRRQLGNLLAGLLRRFGKGAGFFTVNGILRHGHYLAMVYFVLLALAFAAGWWFGIRESWWPVATYVVLLAGFSCFLLTAIAFVFDQHRIPSLLILAAWASLHLSLGTVDHFFPLSPPEPDPRPALSDYAQEYQQCADGRTPRKVAFVVAATGGGIQAAAWSSRVLAALGNDAQWAGFLSGTSGGAVGIWHHLEAQRLCSVEGHCSPDQALRAHDAAATSSLAATAWGLALPDFARVAMPLLSQTYPFVDRARAMERSWEKNCQEGSVCRPGVTLADYVGVVPGFVLNSATVERGYPLLLSTVQMPTVGSGERVDLSYEDGTWHDMAGVTAARLSASFPYITPVAKPAYDRDSWGTPETVADWHAIDGGVLDNSGVFGALTFIRQLQRDDFDLVVLLRLQAYPERIRGRRFGDKSCVECVPTFKDPLSISGWFAGLFGPVNAMLTVWQSGQRFRSKELVDLLSARFGDEGFRVIEFRPNDTLVVPPLSWQLSTANRRYIETSIQHPENAHCLDLVRELIGLSCATQPDARQQIRQQLAASQCANPAVARE